MDDQEDIWAGTEFASGAKPAGAPAKEAAPSDDPWAGTEFAAKPAGGTTTAAAPAAKPDIYKPGRPAAPADMPIGEVLKTAASNIPESALHFGEALVQPILHPIQTAEALGQIGTGVASKVKGALGMEQKQAQKAKDEAAADALWDFYKDRYGSMEGFKRAFMQDPVGIFADASMLLTGGGSLAARLPGMAGKAGEIAATAGRVTDPVNIAAQTIKQATRATTAAASIPEGWTTGVSLSSLNKAAQAGLENNPVFKAHLTGAADPSEAVRRIEDAHSVIAARRGAAIEQAMGDIGQTPLSYQPALDALQEARNRVTLQGTVLNDPAAAALDRVEGKIQEFVNNPNIVPNAANFQKLKVAVRNIKSLQPLDQTGKSAIDSIAKAIRDQIGSLPNGIGEKYMNAMDHYADQSRTLQNIRQGFLSGQSDVTKIRKILSSKDDPLKQDLLKEIAQIDPNIPYMVAGMELNPKFPSGIRGMLSGLASGIGAGTVLGVPHGIASLAAHSPRVIGYTQYGAGRVGGLPARVYEQAPYVPQAGFQAGRAEEVTRNTGGRVARASGGRISPDSKAEQLIRAAESAKKNISKGTEALLDQPDEHIARALAVANRHI